MIYSRNRLWDENLCTQYWFLVFGRNPIYSISVHDVYQLLIESLVELKENENGNSLGLRYDY